MRNAFAKEIEVLADKEKALVLLSGDIGNRLFNPYKERFPDRFYNCGVAEANMTSMAAGMAMSGLFPVTYTITPFNTARCYEQIKIDICYHDLPVVIVGVGAGLSYANLGATHHSFEDIAILRTLPNMHILCPADSVEVRLCLREAVKLQRPVYIRLGKKNEPVIHKVEPDLKIGKFVEIKKGSRICFLSCGNILPEVLKAALIMDEKGVSSKVFSMTTVKPLDEACLGNIFKNFDLVCTVEEHSLIGGAGAAVAEWVVDQESINARLLRLGLSDSFLKQVGSQENARKQSGLTAQGIVNQVLDKLKKGK